LIITLSFICLQSSSPQKYTVKNRSKSTEEVQQAKKAFQTPQKSLPGKPELEDLKYCDHTLLSTRLS
uniref:Uncharacterized protein n=1 Tax=Denticeps clupeoides TaxID=299321 RepID=A0AAY4BI31_9TELE